MSSGPYEIAGPLITDEGKSAAHQHGVGDKGVAVDASTELMWQGAVMKGTSTGPRALPVLMTMPVMQIGIMRMGVENGLVGVSMCVWLAYWVCRRVLVLMM